MKVARIPVALFALAASALAATFGTVVTPPGGASYSDIVLDEARSRLYLVNSISNRIEVYNFRTRVFLASIGTDIQPVSAALSRDGRFLYVTAYTSSLVDVIDLNTSVISDYISLSSNPEGVAVGADGRVLISSVASGASTAGTLQIYDPGSKTLIGVPVVPPAPTPPVLPNPVGRIYTSYRSRLTATPDGKWIVGVNGPTATTKAVFVYETASGTVLRSRNVLNLSTTIAVAADGSKFMAGSTLFDAQTLQVMAQENTANAPFSFPAAIPGVAAVNFNLQANQGGSVFSPDGSVLYAAFNVAPIGAARPTITELLLNDPDNLLINMGIEMPENLSGKMVIDNAGANVYAISDSGVMILPVSTISQSPLAVPHSQSVLLTNDPCGVFKAATVSDSIDNPGKGKITATVAAAPVTPGPGGPGGPGGGGAAAVPPPGASAVNTGATPAVSFRFNTAVVNPGTAGPSDFVVSAAEAINVPNTIHVYQNNRDSISSGTIIPVSINATSTEGLTDILLDSARQRLYITNSGLNRLEVFDTRLKQFLAPIKVGQLPHGMAMGVDGATLYVASTGGESIAIIDLNRGMQTGKVIFPALPFNVAAAAIPNPVTIASSGRGPQFVLSDGTVWKIDGNQAIPRTLNAAIFGTGVKVIPGGNPALWTMASTPGGEYILLMTGSGNAYLYDYTVDDFTLTKQVLTALQGYVGPVTAGPQGRYYSVGGTILNSSLTRVQGSTNGSSPTGRPVAAVTAVSATQLAEFTQPLRATPTATVADAGLIELYDPANGLSAGSAPALEGPFSVVTGLTRVNTFARTLAIDSTGGTAYALTASGLSVIALTQAPANAATRPAVNTGGVVNLADMQPPLAPGGLVSILGKNLGTSGTAAAPLPSVLGGVCVTLNNQPIPLSMTSTGQINGQIPVTLAPGRYPLVIRSIDNQLASTTTNVTVSKYAPAILIDNTGQGAIMHRDGTPVDRNHPAKRDETLLIYATGLGVTHGGPVTSGAAAPASPLADTDAVQVYFGNPLYKQAQVIVHSSNLLPGMIGIDEISVTIPGFHIKGSAVPVTLKIGGVSSPATGSAVPLVAVN